MPAPPSRKGAPPEQLNLTPTNDCFRHAMCNATRITFTRLDVFFSRSESRGRLKRRERNSYPGDPQGCRPFSLHFIFFFLLFVHFAPTTRPIFISFALGYNERPTGYSDFFFIFSFNCLVQGSVRISTLRKIDASRLKCKSEFECGPKVICR